MELSGEFQIASVENHGKIVKLDDGFEWEIHFMDSIRSERWTPSATRVNLCAELGDAYPYKDLLETPENVYRSIRASVEGRTPIEPGNRHPYPWNDPPWPRKGRGFVLKVA